MTPAQFEELASLLNDIGARLERLEARMAGVPVAPAAPKPAPAQQPALEVADDGDLDGPYGNPEIRRDPPRWSGESMVGRRYSECPAEYLDTLAGFKAWSAAKDDEAGAVDAKGRPKSYWAKLDAARARGWAQRIRGTGPKVTAKTSSAASRVPYQPKPVANVHEDETDIPF